MFLDRSWKKLRYSRLIIIYAGCLIANSAYADLDDLDENLQETLPSQKTQENNSQQDSSFDQTNNLRDESSNLSNDQELQSTGTTGDQAPIPKKSSVQAQPETKISADAPIKLKSKGAKANRQQGLIELVRDVVITQGPLELKSDKAKIFSDQVTKEVIKADVTGNVQINRKANAKDDQISAKADHALFLNKKRVVIMRGNASLLKDGTLLKGRKITYDLKTGWINLEGAEGVMQPGGGL
jgi:lipopolysaccharide export system protein LptA